MPAITIHDADESGVLRLDLIDLLRLAGPRASASRWSCGEVEATGPNAEQLHVAADLGNQLAGDELLRLAEGLTQVIEGEFLAYIDASEQPWLRIRAVDSSLFVVATDDAELLARIRAAYHDVRHAPLDDL